MANYFGFGCSKAAKNGGGGGMAPTGNLGRENPRHIISFSINNTQFFTGWMPFLRPNQQCLSTEGTRFWWWWWWWRRWWRRWW